METDLSKSTISSPSELAKLTARFIDQFCNRMAFPSTLNILVDCHHKDDDNRPPQASPLHATLENQKLIIHLREKDLIGISPLSLQGWLDMELAHRQLELEPALYRFNFQKEIRPLFYIAGSGLHMLRHMVAHLETSLKNLR